MTDVVSQAVLLEESWAELFLLCSIQWCLPLHSATIFSGSQFPDLAPALAAALAQLSSVMDLFKELDIDPAEFACLKAIILFKPGTGTQQDIVINIHWAEVAGLRDRKEVESLQDQSLSMLQHQVASPPQLPATAPRGGTRYARYPGKGSRCDIHLK